MLGAVLTRYGGPDAVSVTDFPDPTPAPGEVLVEVHAAGVNPTDFKIRAGKLRVLYRHRRPCVLGEDFAGRVVGLGAGVTRFREGDEVFGCTDLQRMGAYATLAAVPEHMLAKKPRALSYADAAALPLVALTARQAFQIGGLTAGQRLFVRAGSGGIGVVAIQLAKCLGAEVLTTSSAKNVDWVRSLGADRVIDYRAERYENVLSGLDLVMETSLGDELLRSFSILKRGGTLVSIGDVPDARYAKELGLNPVMRLAFAFVGRKATRAARRTGTHYHFFIMRPDGGQLAEVADFVDAGKLKPHVERIYPLADAKDAFAHVEGGHTRGKVVIATR